MDQNYRHLSREERDVIYQEHNSGKSPGFIAKLLGRHRSTIHRELTRNSSHVGYLPDTAQESYCKRRWRGYKLERYPDLRSSVFEKLRAGWSPDVIAGVMRQKRETGHDYVCAESIYHYLYYSSFGRKHELYKLLPWQRVRRRKRRAPACKSRIKERISIHKRPASAMNRTRYGHWEGDLILFSRQKQNIIVTAERKSRFIKASINPSKHTENTINNVEKLMITLPENLRKSITFDCGNEFANHTKLNQHGIKTFFCDPYSSWQKGTVEHANGILRRFLPKKADISDLTQTMLDNIVSHINNIPRKSLNYKSPQQVINRRTSN